MQSFIFRPRRKEFSLSSSSLLGTRAYDLVNRSAQSIENLSEKKRHSNLRLLHVRFSLCYASIRPSDASLNSVCWRMTVEDVCQRSGHRLGESKRVKMIKKKIPPGARRGSLTAMSTATPKVSKKKTPFPGWSLVDLWPRCVPLNYDFEGNCIEFAMQSHAGIFHFLPLGLRVQEKIERLLDKHMAKIGKIALLYS